LHMQRTLDWNVEQMEQDVAAKGWLPVDLARRAGVSHMTVGRFLKGERQTARTAHKLATALGYSVRRYLIATNRAVA
jgi:transcriptional regulator with XRE-family HTH domain